MNMESRIEHPRSSIESAIESVIEQRIPEGSLIVITMIDIHLEQLRSFLLDSARILSQVQEAPGNRGYLIHNEGRKYYTLTAWKDRESMEAFRNSEPHKSAMGKVSKYAGETRFWSGERMPKTWEEAKEILAEEGRTT